MSEVNIHVTDAEAHLILNAIGKKVDYWDERRRPDKAKLWDEIRRKVQRGVNVSRHREQMAMEAADE